MDKRLFEILNYITLAVIAILLLLVAFRLVPPKGMMFLLIFAIILLILRVGFRIFYFFQEKKIK